MEVRYVEDSDDEPQNAGKIGLFITSEHMTDAAVTPSQLLELRAEIDRFLFSRLFQPVG